MDQGAVLARLNDLPSTFTRQGAPYVQIIGAIGAALATFTDAADATEGQVQGFSLALDGWLDVWGLLWGVPRNQGEPNSSYAPRIGRTVLAWVGTVPAIQAWLDMYAPGGTITENVGGLGYNLSFPAGMTVAQISNFLISLARIRPAGVPFGSQQIGYGLFLGAHAFLGTNDYLGAGTQTSSFGLPASTANATPLLPSLYFDDPTINPSLAPTA